MITSTLAPCAREPNALFWCGAWTLALRERFGHAPGWRYSLGAEYNEKKRALILRMFPNLFLFCDVLHLGEDDAETAPTGIGKAVPKDIMALFAGVPCTSASNLNIYSSFDENLNCVENGDLANGSMYHAILTVLHGASSLCVSLY